MKVTFCYWWQVGRLACKQSCSSALYYSCIFCNWL